MDDEAAFLSAILASPGDDTPKLVYADWLEEHGDQKSEFLRLDVEAERLQSRGHPDATLEQRRDETAKRADPAWVAFLTTLGRPYRIPPRSREFFDCEAPQLPFTEPIGMRGRIVTLESQFSGTRSWDSNLLVDLRLLSELELGECWYGAASIPMHPFICELQSTTRRLTGAEVLKSLKARDFNSRYIHTLDATSIPFPGYNPGDGTGIENDEIHNDFFEQHIFQHADPETEAAIDEFAGVHGKLKRAVVDGQMWYVLMHITPEEYNGSFYTVVSLIS